MAGEQKRKIRWAISLFLMMLYFSGLTAQAQYGGGSGEPNDPYMIYTAEQMNEIGLGQALQADGGYQSCHELIMDSRLWVEQIRIIAQ